MIPSIPNSLKELRLLLRTGEGSSLEFKRPTGELKLETQPEIRPESQPESMSYCIMRKRS